MRKSFGSVLAAAVLAMASFTSIGQASEFNQPWLDKQRALVLDAYELNDIDLVKIAQNKRVAGFIHKASDGLSAQYNCTGNETERKLCRTTWRRYAIAKELYHTRRQLAKTLGMKWGAYHLARPGNPIAQAQHFLNYAQPTDDEIMVIDIEGLEKDQWMSLQDAEKFARYINNKTGRWPMLYTNGSTSLYISQKRADFPILSRLPLWYARYKPSLTEHFPKGNWDSYDIWQFASQVNCTSRSCPMRIDGTERDIDINVVDMTVAELKAAWPLDQLIDAKPLDGETDPPKTPQADAPMVMVELNEETFQMPLPKPRFGQAVSPDFNEVLLAAYRIRAGMTDLSTTAAIKPQINEYF